MLSSRSQSVAKCIPSGRSFSSSSSPKSVVFVEGVRTPFHKSSTLHKNRMAYDLARESIKGLVARTAIEPKMVDYVVMGSVIQQILPNTTNLAREALLGAGFPQSVPAHTVTQACISANQAISTGAAFIQAGQADMIVAGGAETFSDVPIKFSKAMRLRFLEINKAKSLSARLSLLSATKLKDLIPEAPAISNFATGEIMGSSSDRLSARWGITRQAMDEFSVDSHKKAAKAHEEKRHWDVLTMDGTNVDNGVNFEPNLEKVSSLKPAFIKPHGTHTAANSSFLSDGGSACLIMSEDKAKELGMAPKAKILSWTYVAVDPFEELLLGPAYAVSKLLNQTGLKLSDIDVIEFHEAFAGQVLSNLAALDSQKFATENCGFSEKVGAVDMAKLNNNGGSLSLGHPFGATGTRLLSGAANRLIQEDGKLALLTACADSGLATAMLVERY